MVIDGRGRRVEDTLMQVRELFRDNCNLDLDIEVRVTDRDEAARVRAFAQMSGYSSGMTLDSEGWRVTIVGGSCRCG